MNQIKYVEVAPMPAFGVETAVNQRHARTIDRKYQNPDGRSLEQIAADEYGKLYGSGPKFNCWVETAAGCYGCEELEAAASVGGRIGDYIDLGTQGRFAVTRMLHLGTVPVIYGSSKA